MIQQQPSSLRLLNSQLCQVGYTGQQCIACAPDFYLTEGNQCQQCSQYTAVWVLLPVAIAPLIVLSFLLIHRWVPRTPTIHYAQILFNHIQILLLVGLNLQWPTQGFREIVGYAIFQDVRLLELECVLEENYNYGYALGFFIFLPGWYVILARLYTLKCRDKFVPLFVASVYFLYPGMAVTFFNAFACVSNDGDYFLGREPQLQCWSTPYFAKIVWFAAILGAWCLFPWIFLFCLVTRYNDQDQEERPKAELQYGFLFRFYRDPHLEWEGVDLLKKTFLAAITAASHEPKFYGQYLTVVGLVFLTLLEGYIKPYRSRSTNNMVFASNVLILLIPALYSLSKQIERSDELGYAVLLINSIFMLYCGLCFLIETLLHQRNPSCQCLRKRARVMNSRFAMKNFDGMVLIQEIQEKLLRAKLLLERRQPFKSQYPLLSALKKFNADLDQEEGQFILETMTFRAFFRRHQVLIDRNRPYEFQLPPNEKEHSFEQLVKKENPKLMIHSPLRRQVDPVDNFQEIPVLAAKSNQSKDINDLEQNSERKNQTKFPSPSYLQPQRLQESNIEDEKKEDGEGPNEPPRPTIFKLEGQKEEGENERDNQRPKREELKEARPEDIVVERKQSEDQKRNGDIGQIEQPQGGGKEAGEEEEEQKNGEEDPERENLITKREQKQMDRSDISRQKQREENEQKEDERGNQEEEPIVAKHEVDEDNWSDAEDMGEQGFHNQVI